MQQIMADWDVSEHSYSYTTATESSISVTTYTTEVLMVELANIDSAAHSRPVPNST